MPFNTNAQQIEFFEMPLKEMVIEPENILMVSEEPHHLKEEVSGLIPEELEVHEPDNCEIVIDELPGAGRLDPELEAALEVKEEEPKKEDKNELKQSKKPMSKWDLDVSDADNFVASIKSVLDSVPKHSGYDTSGCERAVSYLDKLDTEISKAMRNDIDGKLDADKVEKIRAEIDNGKERLHARLDKLKKSKSTKRTKKSEEEQAAFIKTAQKAPTIVGIVMSVPYLIGKIARVCINSMVSSGHDLEVVFDEQVKKYKLDDREQAELMMLLEDMGVPMRRDRGYLRDEEAVLTDGKFDWVSNYQG